MQRTTGNVLSLSTFYGCEGDNAALADRFNLPVFRPIGFSNKATQWPSKG